MILLLPCLAFAWDVDGEGWAWSDAPAPEPFTLNLQSFAPLGPSDQVEAAFETALHTWNLESGANLYVEYGGTTTVTQQGGGEDGHNATLFGDRSWGSGLAVATSNWTGGRLSDCDIQIWESNLYGEIDWHVGASAAPSGGYDLQHTLTHEVGHCLGMLHTEIEAAIMYAYSIDGSGDERRHLHDDDIGGMQFMYGEVAPELTAEVSTADRPGPGESFDLRVTVHNVGDGTAWLASVSVPKTGPLGAGSADVGTVAADTPVGERVGPSSVEVLVPLDVGPSCAVDEVDLDLELTAYGGEWTVPVTVALACTTDDGGDGGDDRPPRNEGEAKAGCGCASGGSGAGRLAALLGLLALAIRRNGGGSPTSRAGAAG